MANRYNFVSPGGEAVDALEGLMTQRKAEARQAMLDEIAKQNAESTRALQQRQIDAADLEAAQYGLTMGQDVSQIDPKYLEILKKHNMVGANPVPKPSVSTDTEFSMPGPVDGSFEEGQPTAQAEAAPATPEDTGIYFSGRPEERDRERIKQQIGSVIGQLNDPNLSELEKFIMISAAMEDKNGLPAGAYAASQPRNPFMVFDEESGKFDSVPGPDGKPMLAGPGDSPIIRRGYRPNDPQGSFSYAGTDPKSGLPVIMNNRTGVLSVGNIAVGAKPTAASELRSKIPPTLYNALATARGKAAPSAGIFGVGGGRVDPKGNEQYRQAQLNIVNAAPVTPDVKDTIIDVINDPEAAGTPTTEIIEAHKGVFNEKELDEFSQLLFLVRDY